MEFSSAARLTSTTGLRLAAALLLPLLASCGGDSAPGASAGTPVVPAAPTPTPTPSPTPAPSPTPTPSPTPSPTPTPTPTSWAAGLAAEYSVQPDIASCRAGQIAPAVLNAAVQTLNTIRALHRLPAVTLSTADQQAAMEAALMMAANAELNHTPPTTWKCYTALGAAGAGSSNLYGTSRSPTLSFAPDEAAFAALMTEVSNLVADNVGHRRWMLDPFLNPVAFGRVAGMYDATNRIDATALKVFNNVGQNVVPAGLPPFVAYPYGEYPARYFDSRALLSFSVVADATNKSGNAAVDFSRATVSIVAQATGAALTVSKLSYDSVGYGIPNNLQFLAAGIEPGTTYAVTITNVAVRGVATNYSYTFRIVP